jgi:hypothetical protein
MYAKNAKIENTQKIYENTHPVVNHEEGVVALAYPLAVACPYWAAEETLAVVDCSSRILILIIYYRVKIV